MIIYLAIYILGYDVVLNNITYEYKHTVTFLNLRIEDNTAVRLYNTFFWAFYSVISIIYNEIVSIHKYNKDQKQKLLFKKK